MEFGIGFYLGVAVLFLGGLNKVIEETYSEHHWYDAPIMICIALIWPVVFIASYFTKR